jgi:hypothetical protein
VPTAKRFVASIKGHRQDCLTSLVSNLNGNLFPSHVGRQVTPELLGCFQSFGVSRLQVRDVLALLVFSKSVLVTGVEEEAGHQALQLQASTDASPGPTSVFHKCVSREIEPKTRKIRCWHFSEVNRMSA